jgi:hypothetical protein
MRHEGYVRNCEHVLEQLLERGHSIHVAIESHSRKAHDAKVLPKLAARWPLLTFGRLPTLSVRPWDDATGVSRSIIDYIRYLDPLYDEAPRLRARVAKRAPQPLVRVLERFRPARHPRVLGPATTLLRSVERVAPSHLESELALTTIRPDLVVFTSLLDSTSSALDYFRSAVELGIPTALCVASWDNLSSKGLVQLVPDKVIVWNDVQKDEAVRMHRIPPDRITVTGAHLFDHWFEMRPSCSREEFCRQRGLDPSRPFLLYVCSSGFVTANEVPFVRRWIEAVRAAGSPLADLGILVRPHSANGPQWRDVDLSTYGNVAVWPPLGEGPVDEDSKQHYFDSLYHCAGVIGINTSALIEGGVVGRHAFTILADDFRETQVGTVHFHYLVQGGLVATTRTLDEHVEQLHSVLIEGDAGRDKAREDFVRDFIRPRGLDTPSSPLAVEALEGLLGQEPVARRTKARPGAAALRLASMPLVLLVHAYVARVRTRGLARGYEPRGVGLINRHRAKAQAGRERKANRANAERAERHSRRPAIRARALAPRRLRSLVRTRDRVSA